MKKCLVVLAAANFMTASVVAQADATLYGEVEARLRLIDNQDANLFVNSAQMGVKGAHELESWDGVEARYQIEWEFDANGADDQAAFDSAVSGDVQTRKANVGLEGDFGIVQFGRQNNLGNAIKKADIFMSAPDNYQTPDRIGNAAYYVTPRMGGFEAYAGLVMDGAGDDREEDLDAWQLGFNYGLMGLDLSVAYTEVDGNFTNGAAIHSSGDDTELWGIGASYSIADLTLAGTYEYQEQGGLEDEMYALRAIYNIGDVTLKAGYSQNFVAGGGNNDFDVYAAQIAYPLGKKAMVKAEYAVKDPDSSSVDETDFITFSYGLTF